MDSARPLFASESFYWSPDSRFVVFGDHVGRSTSVVVVDVAAKDLPVYVHSLNPSEICSGDGLRDDLKAAARLSNVEFGAVRENLPNVWAHFSLGLVPMPSGTTCTKTPLLHSGNLKRGAVEAHKPL